METVPADTPVTTPEASTVAKAVLLLVQLPPVVPPVLVSVTDALSHTAGKPDIEPATGNALTVNEVVEYEAPQRADVTV